MIWVEIRKAVQERYFAKRNSVEFLLWSRDKNYYTVKARIEYIKNLVNGEKEIFLTEEEKKEFEKEEANTKMSGR